MTKDFHKLEKQEVAQWHKDAMKKLKKTGKLDVMDPVLSRYHPGGNLGSVSEAFSQALKKVCFSAFLKVYYGTND
jgi:DNA-directed RNA polymerase I subunit RPA1